MTASRLAWIACALLALPQQVFRSDVRMVPVYATVLDPRGAIVTSLTAADFEVRDNGRPQPITAFASGQQPLTIAILLDNSPSLFRASARAQETVRGLTRELLPGDRACLGTFGHVVSLVPELTSDPSTLVRHLGDDAPFPAGTALWDALEAGRAALQQEAGRRVVLVVTDAADNCSRTDPDVLRSALEREGVMVYAIGLRGREGLPARDVAAIARATGGVYFELRPDDDLPGAMRRVAEELHSQYLVGFAAASLDDTLHRLELKALRPGYTVRARRSYFASSHDPIR